MTPVERRQILLSEMRTLDERGVNCAGCSGKCCTAFANSMQTTPLETRDVFDHLVATGRWTEELRERLRETTTRFRLDQVPGDGRRSFLRRTYYCPFFAGASLGCTIPAEVKPYGCLGFNAVEAGIREGEHCRSDQGLLERQAREIQLVDHQLGYRWQKMPLPMALLEMAAAAAV